LEGVVKLAARVTSDPHCASGSGAGSPRLSAGHLGRNCGIRQIASPPQLRAIYEWLVARDLQAAALGTNTVDDPEPVITMGCGDACPIYPGKRYEDWELDDPGREV
jgi:hypothetical protein